MSWLDQLFFTWDAAAGVGLVVIAVAIWRHDVRRRNRLTQIDREGVRLAYKELTEANVKLLSGSEEARAHVERAIALLAAVQEARAAVNRSYP